MAVDVLGRVIEVVSGMDLDRFIAERVTGPLHMASTDFYVHESTPPQHGAYLGCRDGGGNCGPARALKWD